jgi:hypothetical protein
MATCPEPCGQAPVLSFSGLKRVLAASMLVPTLSFATAFPSLPRMSALTSSGHTVPAAEPTSGRLRISLSSDSGTVAEPLTDDSTMSLPPTTASVSS